MNKFGTTLITILLLGSHLAAQNKHGDKWLLGYGANKYLPTNGTFITDFSLDGPELIPLSYDSVFNYPIVRSTFCSDDGTLLYTTSGCRLYNRLGGLVPGGDQMNPGDFDKAYCHEYIGGFDYGFYQLVNSWNFLDWPNRDSTLFITNHLIFNSPKAGYLSDTIFYKVINNKGDNGYGSAYKSEFIKMPGYVQDWHTMSCRHANGIDWWVLMPGFADKNWYRFLLDKDGLHGPYTQEIEFQKDFLRGIGQSVFSPDGKKYAYIHVYTDEVFLYDFNRKTGELSHPTKLIYPIKDGSAQRGASFSPNSKYLYVSAEDYLYQYDLSKVNIQSSIVKVADYEEYIDAPYLNSALKFSNQQLAPNGKIYFFTFGSDYRFLHVVNNPNEKGTACNFVQRGFPLKSYDAWVGPNNPHYQMTPDTTTTTVYVSIDIGISLSPNPCKDYLNVMINGPNVHDLLIEIIDRQGRVLVNREFEQTIQKIKLDVSALVSGVYYLKVSSKDGKVVSKKFIKD